MGRGSNTLGSVTLGALYLNTGFAQGLSAARYQIIYQAQRGTSVIDFKPYHQALLIPYNFSARGTISVMAYT
jgi:hypothetical protein